MIAAPRTCVLWLTQARVVQELDALVRVYVNPSFIVSDNGTEYASLAILKWAGDNDVDWHYIDPAKSEKNDCIESFYGNFRDELLSEEIFDNLDDARRKLTLWHYGYSNVGPHSSLGDQTPAEARRTFEQFEASTHDVLAQNEAMNYEIKTHKLSL